MMITAFAAFLAGTGAVLAFLFICWALFGGGADKYEDSGKLAGKYDIDDDWAG